MSKYIRLISVVSRLNDCGTFQPQYKVVDITDRCLCSVHIRMYVHRYVCTYLYAHTVCTYVHIYMLIPYVCTYLYAHTVSVYIFICSYHKCVLVHIVCSDTYTPRPPKGSGW